MGADDLLPPALGQTPKTKFSVTVWGGCGGYSSYFCEHPSPRHRRHFGRFQDADTRRTSLATTQWVKVPSDSLIGRGAVVSDSHLFGGVLSPVGAAAVSFASCQNY